MRRRLALEAARHFDLCEVTTIRDPAEPRYSGFTGFIYLFPFGRVACRHYPAGVPRAIYPEIM
jgi:hypothetical protein